MSKLSAALPLVAATMLLATAPVAIAQSAATIDLVHTSTTFSAKHLLISNVAGYIPVSSAKLELGKGNIPTSVEATMDLTKIDTHNDRRDNDLRSERFLDAAKYPEMTFKSTRVTAGTGGAFTIEGTLTMHGMTQPVSLNAAVEGSIRDNQGRTHVGYSATGSLDRGAWGGGAGVPSQVVGSTIQITIEAVVIVS